MPSTVQAFPGEFGAADTRDAVLAPPTCCCCCCCCTVAVPEIIVANNSAKKVLDTFRAAQVAPPPAPVFWAMMAGALIAHASAWLPALAIGVALVVVTYGVWAALAAGGLVIGLGIVGAITGTRIAAMRREPEAPLGVQGFLIGFGYGILLLGGIVGVFILFAGLLDGGGGFLLEPSADFDDLLILAAPLALAAAIALGIYGQSRKTAILREVGTYAANRRAAAARAAQQGMAPPPFQPPAGPHTVAPGNTRPGPPSQGDSPGRPPERRL